LVNGFHLFLFLGNVYVNGGRTGVPTASVVQVAVIFIRHKKNLSRVRARVSPRFFSLYTRQIFIFDMI
jgi:hypothetical protein